MAQTEVKSVTLVAVIEFEQTAADSNTRHYDVLLECGHLQSIESHMPTPPKRIVCKDCLDGEA